MATKNSTDYLASDTEPDSKITKASQLPSLLNVENLDSNDVDPEDDKVNIKNDLLHSADVGTLDTQGSNLPKLTQVIITNVPRLKHNSKDLDRWALRVRYALGQLRLQHLINSSVPRPAKGQHNFNRWVQWSRTVANWLYLQVDEDIQEQLQRLRKIPSKADVLFDKIMKVVRENDKTANADIKFLKYDSQTRADLKAVRKYIAAHKTPFRLLGSNLLPVSSLR